jgi:type I restriction enzyme M protein
MLVDNYLVGVISLPAGVFQPYSGVKTSILWLDKSLAKKTDKILFVKVENDGFDLGAQRRAIKGNDLPIAFQLISNYKNQLASDIRVELESDQIISFISKNEVSGKGDFNLSGDRYRRTEIFKNAVFPSVKIGEVCSFDYGKPLKQEDRFPGDYPVFGSNGIVGYHNAFLVEAPFIVVGRKGSAGEVHFSEKNGFPIDTTFYIKLNNENRIKLRFLFYILKSIDLKNVNVQAGVPGLNRNDAYEIPIPLPPIPIQEEIVSEIESYQKIIDGARQVVENYKPRIEIDPEWEMMELGEVCNISAGGTPSRNIAEYWNGTIPWVGSAVCKDVEVIKAEEYITELGLNKSAAKLFTEGTTLIALVGATIGKTGYLTFPCTTNQNVAGLLPKNKEILDKKYLFYIAQSLYPKFMALAEGKFRMANLSFIRSLTIPLPDIHAQNVIVTSIENELNGVKGADYLIKSFKQKIEDRIAKVWGE